MNMPAPDAYGFLPRFLVINNTEGPSEYAACEDSAAAGSLAEEMAREHPGVFVAIYERKLLMREQVKDDEAAPPA